MNREEVFNFSAGPSVLPTSVLEQAAAELVNYRGAGLSVMEMSHRSREFQDIFNDTKAKLKAALGIGALEAELILIDPKDKPKEENERKIADFCAALREN